MGVVGQVARAPVRAFLFMKTVMLPNLNSFDPSYSVDKSFLENCKPHHREAIELAMTDLYGKRIEAAFIKIPFSWEKKLCSWLNEPRDLSLALNFLQISIWLVFSVTVQLAVLPKTGWVWAAWCPIHLVVTWVILGQRFILGMHYAAHRSLFSERIGFVAKVLNNFPQLVMANFWGMPCGLYYLHHCVMHHQANNVFPYDISSTMPYRRDSVVHLFHYILNFMLHTFVYLPFFAIKKSRFDLAAMSLACSAVYFLICPKLYAWHPNFYLLSIGIPFIIGPIALMLGNFCQHIFVNPENPLSNYGLACNHINAPFNMLTFNDGYHLTHHLTSRCHWSEMPLHFIKNIEKYEENGAIIIKELNFDEMGALVLAGRLHKLAKYVVQITPEKKSDDQIVAMLKSRLQPIGPSTSKMESDQALVFFLNQSLWIVAWLCGFPMASIVVFLAIPSFKLISTFII